MCGIVGYVGTRRVVPILLEGLRRLEYRGYDSAGVATLEAGQLTRRRAEGKLKNLEIRLSNEPLDDGPYALPYAVEPPYSSVAAHIEQTLRAPGGIDGRAPGGAMRGRHQRRPRVFGAGRTCSCARIQASTEVRR